MFKMIALLYVIIAPTLMGAFVIVPLVVEPLATGTGISVAAALGALVAVPVSWQVAKAIRGKQAV